MLLPIIGVNIGDTKSVFMACYPRFIIDEHVYVNNQVQNGEPFTM